MQSYEQERWGQGTHGRYLYGRKRGRPSLRSGESAVEKGAEPRDCRVFWDLRDLARIPGRVTICPVFPGHAFFFSLMS